MSAEQKTPTVTEGRENLPRAMSPPGERPDPTFVPNLKRGDYHYRWVLQRKVDYRRFQGYIPVNATDIKFTGSITAEGYPRLGDCILMKVPIRKYEETIKEREEYWTALFDRRMNEAYNEADRLEGHPFIVNPKTGKEES